MVKRSEKNILSKGIEFYKAKRYNDALTFFLSLPENSGADNLEISYYLGLLYTKLNRYEDALNYLEQVVTFAKIKGVKVETELRKGSPWSEILHVADDFGADLILLGGKEHSASSLSSEVARDRASSTNMDIIGSARCNVLVVRQKDIEKLFKIG